MSSDLVSTSRDRIGEHRMSSSCPTPAPFAGGSRQCLSVGVNASISISGVLLRPAHDIFVATHKPGARSSIRLPSVGSWPRDAVVLICWLGECRRPMARPVVSPPLPTLEAIPSKVVTVCPSPGSFPSHVNHHVSSTVHVSSLKSLPIVRLQPCWSVLLVIRRRKL
jgi:hypothetical protein